MDQVKVFNFATLQQGWEGLNEYLALEEEEIVERGGKVYGTQIISYVNYVIMKKAWVNPDFDFGLLLGYTIKKWSSLVNNYVDMNELDLVRSEIAARVSKNSNAYNFSFHFSNIHTSGKDCLISLIFSKRPGTPEPIVYFHVRAAEITKRVLFDFLLVQRICEYVYGHNNVEVHYLAPSFYITAESFAIYNNIKNIKKLIRKSSQKGKPLTKFKQKCLDRYNELSTTDPYSIKYKVNKRSALQIQFDKDGLPLSGKKSLLAKNLKLK